MTMTTYSVTYFNPNNQYIKQSSFVASNAATPREAELSFVRHYKSKRGYEPIAVIAILEPKGNPDYAEVID